jgi:hypothetical protein
MKKILYFVVIASLALATHSCFSAEEIALRELLKGRITVPELLRTNISYRDRAKKFIGDRDRIHNALKNFYEKDLKNYLLKHKNLIQKHMKPKQVAQIVKEFRVDAIYKRKKRIFLFSRFLRTNYRKWYNKYKAALFKHGERVDKSKGKKLIRNIKKFENLLWRAEYGFAKRFKETKDAYLYAMNRATAKIARLVPIVEKHSIDKIPPEPPPLPEFKKKKPATKQKVIGEKIPTPPPVPLFEKKKKKSVLEKLLKEKIEKRKGQMSGVDVDDDNGDYTYTTTQVPKIKRSEPLVEKLKKEELIQKRKPQSEELLKEIREFKKKKLKPALERKLAPKKEDKPSAKEKLYQDVAKRRDILQEIADEEKDNGGDEEEW